MPQQKVAYFPLKNGEDIVSPDLEVKPGRLRFSKNYEPRSVGGYRRIEGYERYDGQPKPSLANQAFFNIDAVTNTVSVGDELSGSLSGATAYVIGETSGVGTAYDFPDTSAVFIDNDVLTNVTEGNTYATVDLSTEALYGPYTSDSETLSGFIGSAQTVRRNLILPIPGSGPIRGVWQFQGDTYGFRDNAGTVTLSGTTSGSVDSITVNGVEIMSGAVSFITSFAVTAAAVASNITANGLYVATSDAAVITIYEAGSNATSIVSSSTTLTSTDADATQMDMYKDSSSGWVLQTLGLRLAYTVGSTTEFIPGEAISAAPSGATGVVTAINITSGGFSTNDAVGTVFLHTQTGTFAAADTLTGATSGATATLAGDSTSFTLGAGGKCDFVDYNFFGQASGAMMFCAYGTGLAFGWNGSGMALVDSTSAGGFATHIGVQASHLLTTIESSLMISGIGVPFTSTATSGAAEIAVGDVITGLSNPQGDVTAIFSENSTNLLFGTSASTFQVKSHSRVSGAREWTIQRVGAVRYLDDRGLTQLNAVEAFGDFKENSFSKYIDPLIRAKLGHELDSVQVREKDQYRIFFDDGTGLIARIPEEGGFPSFTRINYPITVDTCNTGEDSSGLERVFFGSSDGLVYQMDSGNSFDGAALDYLLRLPYYTINSPRTNKRFFKIVLEVETEVGVDSTAEIKYAPDFSYGNPFRPKGVQETFDVSGGGAYWGEDENWADFFWGQLPNEAEGYIKGSGRNIGLSISGSTTLDGPHTITGVTIQYAFRGVKK